MLKRRHERDVSNDRDKNGKKFTRYIKSKTNCRSTIRQLKHSDGKFLTEDNHMADMLNKFFFLLEFLHMKISATSQKLKNNATDQ